MPAPQIILDLVQRFSDSRDQYRSGHYNEAQLRREFLDPLFTALGWDLTNQQGYAPQYREVIQEASLNIEGQAKAPDYEFRPGQTPKFFVEAKKPAVNIQYDIHPAYQLRRYAWSAHLPLSILTDFEEFAVYDTRIKPDHKDAASVARIFFFRYTDYADKWDEIAAIFSKSAILKGSFDRYVLDNKAKKGTAEVDDDFLSAIETWRELLARNIALRNPQARTERALNFAVQMTLDRIIFLRICEDRGIEPERQLDELAKAPQIYPRLVNLFIKADQKYNSGLFHFAREKAQTSDEDAFTPSLAIDDKALKQIIGSLYYPESPFAFKVIPVEILGQVYEQFLGKVIRLTPAGQAKVEEKPEVRKAGGVYYTPRYIVDYIVQNTVGKLLEGKTPPQVASLRVVDPACGSGSFLLGAYQYLLDWHLAYYLAPENGGPQAFTRGKSPALLPAGDGTFQLTTSEKKRILVNNIYGVDIDQQAVEVTKLSLLLKLLEEETGQLSLGFERVLPDLGHNIRCGNSLIGWDYFQGRLLDEDEEVKRVNPFNWQEAFPEVFAKGGFDAVIGNPPYIDSEWLTRTYPGERNYEIKVFKSAKGNWDIFCIFIEKALQIAKHNGFVSMIVPNKLISAEYAVGIRELLSTEATLLILRNYSSVKVFPVSVYPVVFVLTKAIEFKVENILVEEVKVIEELSMSVLSSIIERKDFPTDYRTNWSFLLHGDLNQVLKEIKNLGVPLDQVAKVNGSATVSEAYEWKNLIKDAASLQEGDLKIINTGTIDRYKFLWGSQPMRYLKTSFQFPILPIENQRFLTSRRIEQAHSTKIIIGGMTKRLECNLDAGSILPAKSTVIVIPTQINPLLLLAILNSSLMSMYYRLAFPGLSLQGGYLRVGPPQISTLPISTVIQDNELTLKIIDLSRKMIALNNELILDPQSLSFHLRYRNELDHTIDRMIYQLYSLTSKDIALLEKEV